VSFEFLEAVQGAGSFKKHPRTHMTISFTFLLLCQWHAGDCPYIHGKTLCPWILCQRIWVTRYTLQNDLMIFI